MTGPEPRIPPAAQLQAMSLDQLKALVAHLIHPYAIQNAPALTRICSVAARKPGYDAFDRDWQLADAWAADASEYREYLSLRPRHDSTRHGRVEAGEPTIESPEPVPPHMDTAQGVEVGAERHVTADPHIEPGSHSPVPAGTAVDAVGFGLHAVEMTTEAFGAGMFGVVAAGVAAFLQVAEACEAGDHMRESTVEMQHYIINFCVAFAHGIRGEASGGGTGASDGAGQAHRVLANLPPAVDRNQLIHLRMMRLYGIAWTQVQAPMIRRLRGAGDGSGAHNALARQAVLDTAAPSGAAFVALGGLAACDAVAP
ncbi:hypothetical protein BH11MYX3_BH11MYX3_21340 [soil metagenome]